MKDYVAGVTEYSGKLVILMDLIVETVVIGDKILVFRSVLHTPLAQA